MESDEAGRVPADVQSSDANSDFVAIREDLNFLDTRQRLDSPVGLLEDIFQRLDFLIHILGNRLPIRPPNYPPPGITTCAEEHELTVDNDPGWDPVG